MGKKKLPRDQRPTQIKKGDMAVTVRNAVAESTSNKMEKSTELDSVFLADTSEEPSFRS